ncbi:Serine/arginine-rich splicing factor 12 [Triticum urartu]|uniref:Serine/arginine-rich splicing factor 12 n=1 Tax=Triticum urartu TaxID=4572 RepID=M7ZC38_TRIUA|nr:Serine/arginine-rich splicing factor 12 [Triticum urartu]
MVPQPRPDFRRCAFSGRRRFRRRRGAYGDFVNLKMICRLSLSEVLIGVGKYSCDLLRDTPTSLIGWLTVGTNMRRGYSYSPSPPPRGYRGRARSPSPRDRYDGRGRDLPTSLLVRNLRRDCRPDDLRRPFAQFGRLKDVYIPRDYYTQEPRGFGFVQYFDPNDAADAKYYMDGQVILGREVAVVFAQENRKKPAEMRTRESSTPNAGHSIDCLFAHPAVAEVSITSARKAEVQRRVSLALPLAQRIEECESIGWEVRQVLTKREVDFG